MSVYVDVLVLVNFIIDYFLLSLTALIAKVKIKFFRQITASVTGAFFSLTILLKIDAYISLLLLVVQSVVIIIIACGFKSVKLLLCRTVCFYAVSFVFSGIMSVIIKYLKPNGMTVNNGVVYIDISAVALVTLSAIIYGIITLFTHFFKNSNLRTRTLIINSNGNTVRITALIDSGNKLKEPFSEKGVIVLDKRLKSQILPLNSTERVVPYSTVGNDGTLMAFLTDGVFLAEEGVQTPLDVYLAFGNTPLGNGIDAIIGEDEIF